MVVFGRPKGDRGSYVQHREGNVAPQLEQVAQAFSLTVEEIEKMK
jgi:hypothetical protein